MNIGLLDEEEIVLDEAALSLAMLDHPGIDIEPCEEVLGTIAGRLAEIGEEADSGRDRAALLAEVLGSEFGFTGDRDNYDDPANTDLIQVIERRRGLPVSLSILYVAAARRTGWTADVLDVPGHVLVLVGDTTAPVIIDPFRGGAVVTPDQLAALVEAATGPSRRGTRPAAHHVATMPNRAILIRLLLNEATRAEAAGDTARALTLYTRMTAFAPSYGHGWWERARLELVDGDIPAARGSLSAMLETTRDPAVRSKVTATLSALARA